MLELASPLLTNFLGGFALNQNTTAFRCCCAPGMSKRPAAPAKKLQRSESLRLLWRRESVCRSASSGMGIYACTS